MLKFLENQMFDDAKVLRKAVLALSLALTAGCQSPKRADQASLSNSPSPGTAAAPEETGSPGLAPVPPLSDEEKSEIVAAMREIKKVWYDVNSDVWAERRSDRTWYGYAYDLEKCLKNTSPWSPLAMHYFCQLHGYTSGWHPNPRECFRTLIEPNYRFTIDKKDVTPQSVFEYCAYMPVNRRGFKDGGAFFHIFEEAHMLAGKGFPPIPNEVKQKPPMRDRPMAWFLLNTKNDNRQERVFKKIMFGDTCRNISNRDQQEIINRFYGVDLMGKPEYTAKDTAQVEECRAKRPLWTGGAEIVPGGPERATIPVDGTHCSLNQLGCEFIPFKRP